MDISIKISNRELNPAVVNFFQFENETTTLNFTLDSYMYGEVDLRNYTAYAITSINGDIDMTELVKTYDATEDKLNLTWDVQEYSLRQEGAITYQIVFKEDIKDGENTAVFYTYKGIMINRGSVDGDNHITANYPTILKQWIDRINELAGIYDAGVIYIPFGETIPVSERLAGRLYYQYTNAENTRGHFEDHLGTVLSELDVDKTNCLTHIPQDIKLELVDGTLTLKAGSKVYVPNGVGVFNTLTIDSDKTLTVSDDTIQLVCINSSNKNMIVRRLANCVSGAGATTTAGFAYNTTTNQVRFFDSTGRDQGTNYSLPIAIITVSGGSITSIDQIFNGFGVIGSTVFALPGVKGLAPNGRNADGTIKNLEVENKYVRTRTFANTEILAEACLFFDGQSFARLSKDTYFYDEVKNVNADGVYEYIHVHIGSCTLTNGVISNFKVKNPFRSVDWNDLKSEYMALKGNQTINDLKTFTTAPIVPTGATTLEDKSAVNAEWVKEVISIYAPMPKITYWD